MERLIQRSGTQPDLIRPRPGHRHIFVFDELMVESRIRELCAEPTFVTTARCLGKRFVINDEGVATLLPLGGYTTYWEIHEVSLTGLDIAQGMPGCTTRFGSLARGPADELVSSDYYGANNRTLGKASTGYLQLILDEGRRRGFPGNYLYEVASWAAPAQTKRWAS